MLVNCYYCCMTVIQFVSYKQHYWTWNIASNSAASWYPCCFGDSHLLNPTLLLLLNSKPERDCFETFSWSVAFAIEIYWSRCRNITFYTKTDKSLSVSIGVKWYRSDRKWEILHLKTACKIRAKLWRFQNIQVWQYPNRANSVQTIWQPLR